ncbi:hypothetical protein [Brachybacterium phenoliresistens]|uniref:Uncharacterized protein n=1 Tax=Brachybacterium phenoliresistens TaxID=396014 RepID=Z9JS53_9MICO|nr:hypothetical protein [Brachybacterium phenoliresistens]EWS81009.1 hypothetical protein BF93_01070 [Brachybacterium phenoliresistens]
MTSFAIGLALILLIAVVTVALGALSHRIAARIDGGRPGRIAAELRPDALQPRSRLVGEDGRAREPMPRLSDLERDGLPHHTITFVGLR